jgi:hypothetical protein
MTTRTEIQTIYGNMSTIISKNEIPEAVRWAKMALVFHNTWKNILQQNVNIIQSSLEVSNSVLNEMDLGMVTEYSDTYRNSIIKVLTRAKKCEEDLLNSARIAHLQMIECSRLAELELEKYSFLQTPDSFPPSPPLLISPSRSISPISSLGSLH